MIGLSRIKLRGFKSFKQLDIPLAKDFVCLAGPNGGGKSNICDGIRFAFGEIRLKALRAKKVKDLIFHNAKVAEVTVFLSGDEEHEIKRMIREDGKIIYKLDGKKTTRTSITDLLKKFNIDESGRNTIAQGEVNRVINMAGKERRAIIESVAGISEFESKKAEAMKNLEIVGTRIRETNLILGERIGLLNELEKEKEIALKYLENKKSFINAKGSLIKKEIEKISQGFEKTIIDIKKITDLLRTKEGELKELEEKINTYEKEKNNYLDEIKLKEQQSALTKQIHLLKLEIGKSEQEQEEKKAFILRLDSEISTLKEEIKKQEQDLKKSEDDLKKISKEYSILESQSEEITFENKSDLRKLVEAEKTKMAFLREELARIKTEITANEQLILEKEASVGQPITDIKSEEDRLNSEIEILNQEIKDAKLNLDQLFENEKKLNKEIAELEKALLSARERTVLIRTQHPYLTSDPLMDFINSLKDKERGIYGLLIDLIKFDVKYSTAIEAAAGPRLLYVVVDNADTAIKIISKIKERGKGRITCIPLKEVKTPSISKAQNSNSLLNYIKFEKEIEKAVQYAFGDTLLVSNMQEAKKIGIGEHRQVTLEGEIFEKSGTICGGKLSTKIAATGMLAKLENETAELKAKREMLFLDLSNLRDEMSKVRSFCAEKQGSLKSTEIKLELMNTEKEKMKKTLESIQKKKQEIKTLESKVDTLMLKKSDIEEEISILSERIIKSEKALLIEEEQLRKQNEELSKKHAESSANISSLRTKKEALFNEIQIRKINLHKSESKLKQFEDERTEYGSKINEIERRLFNQKDKLEKMEAELASSSKELEDLFKKIKKNEEKIQEFGKQRAVLRTDFDKLNKELNALNVKKATEETKLGDLTVEFDSFREFEFLDKEKGELIEIIKNSESFLSQNQTVNLTSIEIYEKKKAEIGDVQEKIQKLQSEKDTIIGMMEEIDKRKKDAFFTTFYAVNDNFKKMFKYIPHVGEGYLYLDKPNEPFESGMFLKVKRGNKEIGLESLSGGESSLIALMFIFALQFVRPSPYYILDEVDSALDKENSKNLAKLIKEMSKNSQFILVTHNDIVMTFASAVFGVSKTNNVSKVVGIKLTEANRKTESN